MTKPIPWIEPYQNGILVRIKVQPQASKTQIVGLYGNPPRLKIRVAAPPSDGKANKELKTFLKKLLKIPGSRIHLVRGETSTEKDVFFEGLTNWPLPLGEEPS